MKKSDKVKRWKRCLMIRLYKATLSILNERSSYIKVEKSIKFILRNKRYATPLMVQIAQSVSKAKLNFLRDMELNHRQVKSSNSFID